MPTILINTNLRQPAANDSSKSVDSESQSDTKENFHNDFKKEINTIISKLMEKSETMDSFLIKYDIDDILLNKGDKPSTKCICERLISLFSEVLTNNASPLSTSSSSSSEALSSNTRMLQNNSAAQNTSEFKDIYLELKEVRKSQTDLSNKFNIVMDKLNCSDIESASGYNANGRDSRNSQKENSEKVARLQYRHMMALKRTANNKQNHKNQILTGAKKRKSSALIRNSQENQDPIEINHIGDSEEEGAILGYDQFQTLDDSLSHRDNMDVLSEKLNDEYENVQSRDCPSRFSTMTSSSKLSVTRMNPNESSNIGDYNDSDDLDNHAHFSEIDTSPKQTGNNNHNEEVFACSITANQNATTKVEQRNLMEENELTETMDQENQTHIMDNYDEYLNENEKHSSKETAFNPIPSENRRNSYSAYSIYQNLQQQKQSTSQRADKVIAYPRQPQMAPNQKFRFINQSPTPASIDYQSQPTYYPIPQSTARFNQVHAVKQPSNNYNHNYMNRCANNIRPTLGTQPYTSSSSSSVQEMKYKSNGESAAIRGEMATDIDINELFKDGGPRFLQMDLYKNFKPPICIVQDKYYIDNVLASSAYSKSKSRRNFASHLAKLVFTPRERLESNCNGRFGKKALDTTLLSAIRNTLFKFYPCKHSTLVVNGDTITSGDHDENNVWLRDCIPAIDESNRVLKKQLIAWYKKNHLLQSNNSTGLGGDSRSSPASSYATPKRGYNFDGHLGGLNSEKVNMNEEEYEENNFEEDFDI